MDTEKPKKKCINCHNEPVKSGYCGSCHPALSAMVVIKSRIPESEMRSFGESMAKYKHIKDMQQNGSPVMSCVALVIRSCLPKSEDWFQQANRIIRLVSNELTKP
jgi:hypothetical protein